MREKPLALLLSGALVLSLTACSASGEPTGPSEAVSQPAETAAPSQTVETAPPTQVISLPPETAAEPEESSAPLAGEPEPAQPEASLPPRDYQPWQTGYMSFLSGLLQAENSGLDAQTAYSGLAADDRGVTADWGEPIAFIDVMAMGSESYSLYDVDKDGVPELFVQYGSCEADFATQCYTYREGQVVCIGEFTSGHSALYTNPGKSAVLRHEAHMGFAGLYEYPMEDGRLTQPLELLAEEDVEEYTEPSELVPGAELLGGYYTELCMMDFMPLDRERASVGVPRLLPICDWGRGPAATGHSSESARSAILAALRGETKLYGASGDGFYGDMGWTTWAQCVQPGGAYPYNETPFSITRHVWLDMNGDGQEECVLRIESEDSYPAKALVVLSEQSGTVYAYYFGFYDEAELCADGTISNTYGGTARLSFWRDQCYEYGVQPAQEGPVKWVDGSPVG